jgi:acetyl esterase/lipase
MATVVAMMAKKKGPTIKLQVLFWPVTANFETESYNLFCKDRFLTKI